MARHDAGAFHGHCEAHPATAGEGTTIACSSGVGGGSHVYSAVNLRPLVENFPEGHASGVSDAAMSPHYDAVLERRGAVTPRADHRIPNPSSVRFRESLQRTLRLKHSTAGWPARGAQGSLQPGRNRRLRRMT